MCQESRSSTQATGVEPRRQANRTQQGSTLPCHLQQLALPRQALVDRCAKQMSGRLCTTCAQYGAGQECSGLMPNTAGTRVTRWWLFMEPQSPPPGRRSPQLVQQDSVESGLSQLQLQASGDAGRTASGSRDSSSHAGKLAAGAAAAAGSAAAAAGDEAVSQSRASSQIRVKKFNKLLGEPLVSSD